MRNIKLCASTLNERDVSAREDEGDQDPENDKKIGKVEVGGGISECPMHSIDSKYVLTDNHDLSDSSDHISIKTTTCGLEVRRVLIGSSNWRAEQSKRARLSPLSGCRYGNPQP